MTDTMIMRRTAPPAAEPPMMAARWSEFDDDWEGITLAMRLCVV